MAQEIAFLNDSLGANLSAAELHSNGLLLNPDMSPEKGRAYIDTMIQYFAPRACLAFGLEECVAALSPVVAPDKSAAGLAVWPNPASDEVLFSITTGALIQELTLYDIEGRVVRVYTGLEAARYCLKRAGLPAGVYVASARSGEGITNRLIVLE